MSLEEKELDARFFRLCNPLLCLELFQPRLLPSRTGPPTRNLPRLLQLLRRPFQPQSQYNPLRFDKRGGLHRPRENYPPSSALAPSESLRRTFQLFHRRKTLLVSPYHMLQHAQRLSTRFDVLRRASAVLDLGEQQDPYRRSQSRDKLVRNRIKERRLSRSVPTALGDQLRSAPRTQDAPSDKAVLDALLEPQVAGGDQLPFTD